RRKLAQQEQKYVLIRSIPPTSNIVESPALHSFAVVCGKIVR
ncbi:hypothetical protein L917_13015, partial [Phytophthora nicotianae]